MHTMGKTTFLTPVYFFSSIRAGSGKASVVANLAIFLNNLSQKVAIVDLDHDAPLKIKNSFPASITLQEYGELSQLAQSSDSRYQKSFYFTDTSQISYFPGHKLKDPALLFSDTTLRDFIIQVKASFDVLLINFPAGPDFGQKVSDLLTRTYLWRGSKPVSIITSLSDERSLVSLDALIQTSPAFLYQLKENTLLLFNRVPNSPDEQRLADNSLNSMELRKLFSTPLTYVAGINEEVHQQRLAAAPFVLNSASLLHQTISGLHRVLSRLGENPLREITEKTSDFYPVLDGDLLEKLGPYLEKIQNHSAARLFSHPSQIQVFLEENENSFRIRIRTSGIYQPLLGIDPKIPVQNRSASIYRDSPHDFAYGNSFQSMQKLRHLEKVKFPTISISPIYRFDDRFAWKTAFSLQTITDIFPRKNRYPSPILFKPANDLPEVPSLAHILGFTRKKYKALSFPLNQHLFTIPGVTHFFIPPEFDLVYSNYCHDQASFNGAMSLVFRQKIIHSKQFVPAYELPDVQRNEKIDLPDIFARNQPFVAEHDFLPRQSVERQPEFGFYNKFAPKFINNLPLEAKAVFAKDPGAKALMDYELCPTTLPLFFTCRNTVFDPDSYHQQSILSCPPFPVFKMPIFSEKKLAYSSRAERQQKFSLKKPVVRVDFSRYFLSPATKLEFAIRAARPQTSFSLFSFTGNQTGATSLDLLTRVVRKLPEKLFIEALLLDHAFSVGVLRAGKGKTSSPEKIPVESDKFSYRTFFRQDFCNKPFSAPPGRFIFCNDSVKQIFQVASTGFKPFVHIFNDAHPNQAYEIFTVAHGQPRERLFKDPGNISIYRIDKVLDASKNKRSMALLKQRMLEIGSTRAPVPTIISRLQSELFRVAHQSVVANCDPIIPQIENIPNRLDIRTSLSEPVISGTKSPSSVSGQPAEIAVDQKFTTKQILLAYKELNLLTIPGHSALRKFFSFTGVKAVSIKNLQIEQINQILVYKDLSVKKFSYDLVYSDLEVPVRIPTRSKKVEIPAMISSFQRQPEKIIIPGCTPPEKQTSDNFYFQTGRKRYKNTYPSGHHRLAKLSPADITAQPFKLLTSPRSVYKAIFPDIYEEFFNLLQRNLKTIKEQDLQHHFQRFTRQNELVHCNYPNQCGSFINSLSFSEKPLETTGKLRNERKRILPALSATKMRDLINFARQAGQKFSEINTRIQL